jgi:hypothetical protein
LAVDLVNGVTEATSRVEAPLEHVQRTELGVVEVGEALLAPGEEEASRVAYGRPHQIGTDRPGALNNGGMASRAYRVAPYARTCLTLVVGRAGGLVVADQRRHASGHPVSLGLQSRVRVDRPSCEVRVRADASLPLLDGVPGLVGQRAFLARSEVDAAITGESQGGDAVGQPRREVDLDVSERHARRRLIRRTQWNRERRRLSTASLPLIRRRLLRRRNGDGEVPSHTGIIRHSTRRPMPLRDGCNCP